MKKQYERTGIKEYKDKEIKREALFKEALEIEKRNIIDNQLKTRDRKERRQELEEYYRNLLGIQTNSEYSNRELSRIIKYLISIKSKTRDENLIALIDGYIKYFNLNSKNINTIDLRKIKNALEQCIPQYMELYSEKEKESFSL